MKFLKQMTMFLALLAALVVCQGITASSVCSGIFNKHLAYYKSKTLSGKIACVLTCDNQEKP
jgi:hypothetical protein